MGFGLVAAGLGALGGRKNKKDLDKLLKNAPKYETTPEAFDNQAMAKSQAFGRDRAIQGQEQQIEQQGVDAMAAAKDVTSSTSGLLSTIAAINANQDAARRGLAQDEAAIQQQKMQQLYGANSAVIDEKDKAWNFNTNMPYQMKVAALRDRKKANDELFLKGIESQAATDAAAMESVGNMIGGMGGMMSDVRLKRNIAPISYGIDSVMNMNPVEFEYKHDKKKHIGFIAQEVQETVPEVVQIDGDTSQEYLKIQMIELIPVLVKAIQEQQVQISALREELAKQTA
jgi:hypothetical protein